MLRINLHCHNRCDELRLVLNSLKVQKLSFKPDLNVIIDPVCRDVSREVLEIIKDYEPALSQKYNHRLYSYRRNVGLAAAIINALRQLSTTEHPTIVLEDDIVLLDTEVLQDVNDLFNNGFSGHVNLWQPQGRDWADRISYSKHMWCWGWAADHRNIKTFLENQPLNLTPATILSLSSWGFDFINHLVVNLTNKKKTWAIYYYIFVYTNSLAVYNFAHTRSIEVSTAGTNRKSTKIRTIISQINHFLVLFFLRKPQTANNRYKCMFLINLFLPFRFIRSIYQIIYYRKLLKAVNMDIPTHKMIKAKI